MGNGGVKRYIGGKKLDDYFKSEIKPQHDELFNRLEINESKGFELLRVFVKIDTKELGAIKALDIIEYFGGNRTKFTDRLLAIYVDFTNKPDLLFSYKEFLITFWNLFSFNPRYMARFLFEMMDIERTGVLEKPDLETMYKFMYDCDEYDPVHINPFPINKNGKITKNDFIDYLRRKSHLIQPALDYQKRLMTLCGGLKLWSEASNHRREKFIAVELEAETLEEVLQKIVKIEVKASGGDDNEDADSQLFLQQQKLAEEIQAAQQDLMNRQKEKEEINRLRMIMSPEDIEVEKLWWALSHHRREFEAEVFLFDAPQTRRQRRMELFDMFDKALEASVARMREVEEAEVVLTQGTDEDRAARVDVFVSSEEGVAERERLVYLEIIRGIRKAITDNPGKGPAYTMKLRNVDRVLNRMEQGQRQQQQSAELANKYASKQDRASAEERAIQWLGLDLTAKAVAAVREKHAKIREAQLANYKNIEDSMIVHFGSRSTKWELVTCQDAEGTYRVFLNTETLKTYPEATAICEVCDSVLDTADVKCFVCGTHRNERNAKFYKGLTKLVNI